MSQVETGVPVPEATRAEDVPSFSADPGIGQGALRYLTKPFHLFIWIGLTLANFYSWQMAYTGLIVTRLLPIDARFMSGEKLAMLMTGVLQIYIFAFYFLLPFIRREVALLTFGMAVFFMVFVGFNATLAMFSITKTSYGEALAGDRASRVSAAHDQLTRIDRSITQEFQGKIAAYDSVAARALRGEDETGTSLRGPIYRKNKAKANLAISRYSGISMPIAANEERGAAIEQWRSWQIRRASLEQKVGQVAQFNAEPDLDKLGVDVERTRAELSATADILASDFNGGIAPNENDLVFNKVTDQLKSLIRVSASRVPITTAFLITLFMSVLPDLISIALALLSRTLYTHQSLALQLGDARKISQRAAEDFEAMAATEARTMKAREKVQWAKTFSDAAAKSWEKVRRRS
jgi:hypothetical protein